jgi:FtsH-binding integral membrane protein
MLLAAILAALTFRFPFYSGQVAVDKFGHEPRFLTAWPHYINGRSGSVLLLIVTLAIIVGSLWNIFNYKSRSKQFWITIGLIALSLLNIVLYWFALADFQLGTFSLTAIIALAIPVCLFLAAKGIKKDEKLVKSADRLR